jgi:hypothetical protein
MIRVGRLRQPSYGLNGFYVTVTEAETTSIYDMKPRGYDEGARLLAHCGF